jgi:arylformamidase
MAASALLASTTPAAGSTIKGMNHAYGGARQQRLDIYRPESGRPAPLILFVHGGGWSAGSKAMGEGIQPGYFTGKGYAWASLDYRLIPSVTVEEQMEDVARAIAWLVRHGKRLGLDTRRIVLISHSSGAHLAGLIATDPQWLNAAGAPFSSIAGVVSIDGAGLDVPGAMASGAASSPFYARAFGNDAARYERLSPLAHVGVPDAPHWLFLFDRDHNESAGYFAGLFAAAAEKAGASALVIGLDGTTHMKMLNRLGDPDDPVTGAVERFLEKTVKPQPDQ